MAKNDEWHGLEGLDAESRSGSIAPLPVKSRCFSIVVLTLLLAAGAVFSVWQQEKASLKATQVAPASQRELPATSQSTNLPVHNSIFAVVNASLEAPQPSKPELAPQIQECMAQPKHRPKMTGLTPVDAAGEEFLIQKYREIDAITNKAGLIRLMAYTGGDKVFEVFAHTLTNELAGRALTREEAGIVGYMPQLMGILARRSDLAFEFLKTGMEPDFWRQNISWKTQIEEEQPRVLCGSCLKGLALSGRPGVKEIITSLRSQTESPYVRTISGSIVTSVFIIDLTEKFGIESFMDGVYTADINVMMKAFGEWTKTPNGSAWRAWWQKVARSR